MRIISGEFKGRRISAPKGEKTRPMPDRAKVAIFNMLRGHFEGVVVLDLFAGSGATGLEALSRGASRCLFVERDRDALRALQGNVEILGVEDRCEVIQGDALGISIAARTPRPVHLVFLDPPYELVSRPDGWERVREQMARLLPLVDSDGFLIVRTPWPFVHRGAGEASAAPADPDLTLPGADGPETHVYRHTAVHLYAPASADDPVDSERADAL